MRQQEVAGNRKNLLILSFTLIVVMLGFGMVIPVFPFFVVRLGAGGSTLGLLVATGSLTEPLFGPLWGSISDRVGRKPILMIGMLGYGLSMVLFGLSTELWMLFASRGLSGVLSAATLSTAMAYIADSTGVRERGGGMGALGGAAGLGIILGPGLGGWLAGESLATPFFIAGALSMVSMLLIALLLPETLPPEARVVAGRIGLVDFRALSGALRSPVGGLLLLVFIGTIGTSNFEAIFSLYALDVLGYGPERVGAILTVVGGVSVIGRGLLTGLATRKWGETAGGPLPDITARNYRAGRGDGPEQLLREPRAGRRTDLGRGGLRPQPQLPVPQRGRDPLHHLSVEPAVDGDGQAAAISRLA